MNLLKTNLIAILILGAVAVTGIVTAEQEKQASTPESRVEKQQSPAELTSARCLVCHGNTHRGQGRLAPPFAMVKSHYQSLDEDAFIKTVSDWVKAPDKQKSRMPGAVRRFGLMPALAYPEDEVTAIAKYIYKTDFIMPGRRGRAAGQDKDNGCTPGKSPMPKADVGTEPGDPGKDDASNAEPCGDDDSSAKCGN